MPNAIDLEISANYQTSMTTRAIATTKTKDGSKDFDRPFTSSRQMRHDHANYVSSIFEAVRQLPSKYGSVRIEGPRGKDNGEEDPQESPKVRMAIRSLTKIEVSTLIKLCACQCEDWSTIFVMYFDNSTERTRNYEDLSKELQKQISRCTFKGYVVIGVVIDSSYRSFKPSSSQSGIIPYGMHSNALVADSIVEPYATIYNNTIISDSFIGSHATITNCGTISSTSDYPFEDSMDIHLGPEAGGNRRVNVTPESTLVDVCSYMRISNLGKLRRTSAAEAKRLPFNIILGKLHFTSIVSNLYLAPSALIESCSSISNSILLPCASIRNSTVTASYLQWDCSISDNSTVSNTILMESCAIGPHSVVASTVLGPDSHVSCGEVHCSLIGPNTNSHHQSLLISALWPMGRGNVGYGSNIGSNHTGRIPDQECTIGEGIFWGLGCVIKFPVDLSRAFYSVVAAGVQLPPQRCSMPFCLIMEGSSSNRHNNEAMGRNEIVPGWILKSSPYTIVRSEVKFKNRRKAKRHSFYCGWMIIRPTIVDSCVEARNLLKTVAKKLDQVGVDLVYTESQLPQLGSNYMTERGRKLGIDTYTNLILRYALQGLLQQVILLQASGEVKSRNELSNRLDALLQKPSSNKVITVTTNDKASWPLMPWEEELNDLESLWDHQRSILQSEIPYIAVGGEASIFTHLKLLLGKLVSLEQSHAAQVYKSKQRDDLRGTSIIPDYRSVHTMAEDDDVIKLTNTRTKDTVKRVTDVLRFYDGLELDHKSRSRL